MWTHGTPTQINRVNAPNFPNQLSKTMNDKRRSPFTNLRFNAANFPSYKVMDNTAQTC